MYFFLGRHVIHNNKTPFIENPKPKMQQKNHYILWISIHKLVNETSWTQNKMYKLQKNISQLFWSKLCPSIVTICLKHLSILYYVHIVQDFFKEIPYTNRKKRVQNYLYTMWFFYMFTFICGVEGKGVDLYGLKYGGTKFEFVDMIC
jgi:hypothetical protein